MSEFLGALSVAVRGGLQPQLFLSLLIRGWVPVSPVGHDPWAAFVNVRPNDNRGDVYFLCRPVLERSVRKPTAENDTPAHSPDLYERLLGEKDWNLSFPVAHCRHEIESDRVTKEVNRIMSKGKVHVLSAEPYYYVLSRRMPRVRDSRTDFPEIALDASNPSPAHRQIRAQLGVASCFSMSKGFLAVIEGHQQGDQSGDSNWYLDERGDEQPHGPPRHVPLSLQIALAALVVAAGFYYLLHAFCLSARLGFTRAYAYALLALGGVLCGVAMGFGVLVPG